MLGFFKKKDEPQAAAPTPAPQETSWLQRLSQGLRKSSDQISDGITGIFTRKKLDAEALEELEMLLIQADMGAMTAASLVAELKSGRFEKDISSDEVRRILADAIAKRLEPVAIPFAPTAKPHVAVMVGVNGNGKTTTIGKLAQHFTAQGLKVYLAAADTFRAAAVEQLQVWGQRTGCPVITGAQGADSASVAFRALEEAKAAGADLLLIDTAGRLQNKSNLMQELQKILKVLRKQDENAPHSVIQVLDATTGQNAIKQVETFKEMVEVNGMIVTKLDGTAKGGVVVALADKFKLPIHAIGVGESASDLQPFKADDFASNLVGLDASA